MKTALQFSLLSWAFHQGGSTSPDEVKSGANGRKLVVDALALDFIPGSLRRRCSPFSRASLAVAYAAARGDGERPIDMPTVFASAHGESEITEQLLGEIARRELLSPMGFSLSVHNAASGIFSIATGNKAPASAIAANEHSFMMGLCEAAMILTEQGHDRVLFVSSDDLVPAVFLGERGDSGEPHALALLIARPDSNRGVSVTVERELSTVTQTSDGCPPAMKCAQWLVGDGAQDLRVPDSGGMWCFHAQSALSHLRQSALRSSLI
jgi:hypothetical protein